MFSRKSPAWAAVLASALAAAAAPGGVVHAALVASSPLVGTQAKSFAAYARASLAHPELGRLGHALYFEDPSCPSKGAEPLGPPSIATMIPAADATAATAEAEKLLSALLGRFGLSRAQAVSAVPDTGLTMVSPAAAGRPWSISVLVAPQGLVLPIDGRAYFVPSALIALHELGHVARIAPGETTPARHTGAGDSVYEIGPALEQVVTTDEVYKRVHGLALDRVVAYPKRLPANGRGLELGVLANTMRVLWARYGTMEAALLSDEGLRFVGGYYKSVCP
ncbi:MAG: hypothetical protein HY075_07285 [Deltaproteobacteria bacterium]|nr:hypothetical protein [Deltaproteobacteria bacterium]